MSGIGRKFIARQLLGTILTIPLIAGSASAQAPQFEGKIAVERKDSIPAWPQPERAPDHAPNIVLIMLDDVGFAAPATFGGAIPTPALSELASRGLKYNNFHTSGICSPSRAALLTGRNGHRVGFGTVSGGESGFPGYNGLWNPKSASIAQVLNINGYSTAAFGKWHNTPLWETSPAGPFKRWPTGLGFDYFYGFMGGEASQWQPFLYRNNYPIDPGKVNDSKYNFNKDIVDDAISWMHTQKSIAPDRPYFLYFTPGATHAPLHVGPEWTSRFKGHFDMGWDELRANVFAEQKRRGIVPRGTSLSKRPDELPAWSSLSPDQKRLAAQQMEVYAGFLAQTDFEVGRLIKAVREAPGGENTLIIYIVGDNGASPEGGLNGSDADVAEAFGGARRATVDEQLGRADKLGSDLYDNHFAVPWAWALSTPFPWMKQVASHLGATRNPMIVSWPARIKSTGIRGQFTHLNDIAPTIYDLVGLTPPVTVNGIEQMDFDGKSIAKSFDDAEASTGHDIQYFEVLGNRAIYKSGWFASARHSIPWELAGRSEDFVNDPWELYNLNVDFAQSRDLAKNEPAKLAEMKQLFDAEARRNDVYPLSNFPGTGNGTPSIFGERRHFEFYPDTWPSMPNAAPMLIGSHTITAEVVLAEGKAEGVIVSNGGRYGGYALYVLDGHLTYQSNAFGRSVSTIRSSTKLAGGKATVSYQFKRQAPLPWGGGTGHLLVNGQEVASGQIDQFGLPSFMGAFCIGRDCGTSTGEDYTLPFRFNGQIGKISMELNEEPNRSK